jgi:hypothetical protein
MPVNFVPEQPGCASERPGSVGVVVESRPVKLLPLNFAVLITPCVGGRSA